MSGHKVIAISAPLATILTTVIASGLIGSISYAWAANAEMAQLKEKVDTIVASNITAEFPVVKEQVKQIKETTTRIEVQQEKTNDKLDRLLQQRPR